MNTIDIKVKHCCVIDDTNINSKLQADDKNTIIRETQNVKIARLMNLSSLSFDFLFSLIILLFHHFTSIKEFFRTHIIFGKFTMYQQNHIYFSQLICVTSCDACIHSFWQTINILKYFFVYFCHFRLACYHCYHYH